MPRVGCANGPFFPASALDLPPPLIEDSSTPEVADAIAPFLEGAEGGLWPQDGWRVLEIVESDHVLIVHPGSNELPSVAFMSVEWNGDEWRWSGSSIPNDCILVVEPRAEDGAIVDWRVDPTVEPPRPETTTLILEATERGCASGQPMGDRLNEPEVTFTNDAVLIRLTTQPREGGQNCPGNPSQRVEVELAEPLRNRKIRDARETDLGELQDILQALIESDEATQPTGENSEPAEEATGLPLECDAEVAGQIATEIVDALLAQLVDAGTNGDFRSAAELWTGFYADDDASGFLRGLVERNGWLLDGELETVAVDSYTHPQYCPGKVVAVTDQQRRGTFAVLVDPTGTIQRIQHPNELPGPLRSPPQA